MTQLLYGAKWRNPDVSPPYDERAQVIAMNPTVFDIEINKGVAGDDRQNGGQGISLTDERLNLLKCQKAEKSRGTNPQGDGPMMAVENAVPALAYVDLDYVRVEFESLLNSPDSILASICRTALMCHNQRQSAPLQVFLHNWSHMVRIL
jgi:hypothetical protein